MSKSTRKDLIISAGAEEVDIAFVENGDLVELHKEKKNNNFAVGDIFLGRVKKIIPSLNAAFVDVGYEKDAFLHYHDLGPQIKSFAKYTKLVLSGKQKTSALNYFRQEKDIDKGGKITDVLSGNQQILVQIAKEPISSKGPRITSEVTLAGRYVVLIPFSEKVSISQKIESAEERDRLIRLVKSIKPKNFGVIIRTVARDKKVADLDKDLRDLLDKWDVCFKELKKAKPPQKVLGELDRTAAILRDLLNSSFSSIVVDNPEISDEIKNYLKNIAPDKEKIVKLHKAKSPVFDHHNITKQIKGLFGKTVNLKSGAYLIIEHTEALHVVDVNSGNRAKSGNDQESNALEVNLEAAEEIARQLRLRDIGGIIVVDFIDMQNPDNRKKLYDKVKNEMSQDRAKHKILPPSKFGLVQITRQRVRPEMNISTSEQCPTCGGTGKISAPILLMDEIEDGIRYVLKELNKSSVKLYVHPFLEAYITKGVMSIQKKWAVKYRKWIKVKAIPSFQFLEYRFFDSEGEEIMT